MGQYRLARANSLTKEEWCSQTSAVKSNWGENICKKSWGNIVRVRIALRKKLGRDPDETELTNADENDYNVTPEEVICAYDQGKERISVWTMECIGYDEAFQREVCDKFRTWQANIS